MVGFWLEYEVDLYSYTHMCELVFLVYILTVNIQSINFRVEFFKICLR